MKQTLIERYRMSEQTLELRKQFIRLGPQDIRALARLAGWARRFAPRIAREFYDHQFTFPETRAFFEAQARRKNLSMEALRQRLESAQAQYLRQIFEEAEAGGAFGTAYFERRLAVGRIHNLIDLPPKWYFGSYTLHLDLIRKYLRRALFFAPWLVSRAERAVYVVFNYDMQAISDAFTLDMMEAAGMDLVHVEAAVGHDLTEYIGHIKTAFAAEIREIGEALAAGDLTLEITPLSENDTVRKALQHIVLQLRDTLRQVSANVSKLNRASAELAAIAEQARAATSQIATAIQEMAQGITQQAQSVERAACSMQQMSRLVTDVAEGTQAQSEAGTQAGYISQEINETIQQVASSAQTGAERAALSAQQAQSGAQTVERNTRVMASIREKVGLSAEKVEEMGRRSSQIGVILETIEDIAGQTNLLALNAAIEAARAGDHGRGFAVVADEVRKLAEKSGQATHEIAALIRGIQETVAEAVSAMEAGAQEVAIGMEGAAALGKVFDGILNAVEIVSQQVETIAAAAQQLSASSSELTGAMHSMNRVAQENGQSVATMQAETAGVTRLVETITGISQESSAGAEEVSATTQEMTAQVAEVQAAAQSLAVLAQELDACTRRFRLPEAANEAPPRHTADGAARLRVVGI